MGGLCADHDHVAVNDKSSIDVNSRQISSFELKQFWNG